MTFSASRKDKNNLIFNTILNCRSYCSLFCRHFSNCQDHSPLSVPPAFEQEDRLLPTLGGWKVFSTSCSSQFSHLFSTLERHFLVLSCGELWVSIAVSPQLLSSVIPGSKWSSRARCTSDLALIGSLTLLRRPKFEGCVVLNAVQSIPRVFLFCFWFCLQALPDVYEVPSLDLITCCYCCCCCCCCF